MIFAVGPRGSPISTAPMVRNTENLKIFKEGCWEKEHSSSNSMIFVDYWSRPIRPRVDLKVLPTSMAPMVRNTELNGCLNQEPSPANSTIFVDLRFSSNFGISDGKIRI